MKMSSAVFTTLPSLFESLASADFPPIPQNPKGVQVRFGAYVADAGTEAVVVTCSTRQAREWATEGTPGVNDDGDLTIYTWSSVPGLDAMQAWCRLQAICVVIDETLRDPTTGKPAMPEVARDAGVWQWLVSSIETQLVPVGTGGNGWMAEAVYTVSYRARI